MSAVNDPAEGTEGDGRGVQEGSEAVGQVAPEGREDEIGVSHGMQAGEDRAEPGEKR